MMIYFCAILVSHVETGYYSHAEPNTLSSESARSFQLTSLSLIWRYHIGGIKGTQNLLEREQMYLKEGSRQV